MLKAFNKLFSHSSSLQAKVFKSAAYTCGMKEEEIQRVKDASGFTRSKRPFGYLGVSIWSKKITAAQCECIVEKMTARIKIWSTRNLSYGARTLLINAVFLCLHRY